MIPTLQLGQTGQAYNRGRPAWRAVGTSNMTFASSTDYTLNITQNVRDDGRNRVDPDSDRFTVSHPGWYVCSGGYQMSSYPSGNGYNSTTMSLTPPSPLTAHPLGWHENWMTTGYTPAKMLFGVGYGFGGSTFLMNGNQYSGNSMTVLANTIYQSLISLHNNMIPYGIDIAGSGTSLLNATSTPLTYTTAYRDDGGFWNGAASTQFIIPPGAAGWYAMSGWYRLLDPTQLVGGARSWWRLNGAAELGGSSTACNDGSKSPPATLVYYLNEGDYVEFIADQNVGSTRTTERHRVGLARVSTTNGVFVTRSTAQTVTASTTATASFDTEVRDDLGAWTISDPTKLTVPSGGSGWYIVCGSMWCMPLDGFDRELRLIVDGTTEISRMEIVAPTYHNDPRLCVTTAYYLTEGQYVELQVRNGHTSSSVNTYAGHLRFGMVKVEG